ncbi:hypothetical protein [Maritimibacter sp. HL-12]|uniref:hypothetical protein n=1 Tax=Maritimibacter sp. HL-12 TaxID=1162418 RepID=UPI000A1C88D3|nr:hypothetical protein [Maritimibacter sp. HL-12]
MSQILSWLRPPYVPKSLTMDSLGCGACNELHQCTVDVYVERRIGGVALAVVHQSTSRRCLDFVGKPSADLVVERNIVNRSADEVGLRRYLGKQCAAFL